MKMTLTAWMASIQVRFFTWRKGKLVGTDAQGNRYYADGKKTRHGRERRWVIYAGEPEASKVPPEWHGWLHFTYNTPMAADSAYHQPWVKPHHANLTGTNAATFPAGHALGGGHRAKAVGDYEAWKPEA